MVIERHGKRKYFPREEYHILSDSAFPLRDWLMTPFKNNANLKRIQRHHNRCLSNARVCIENLVLLNIGGLVYSLQIQDQLEKPMKL